MDELDFLREQDYKTEQIDAKFGKNFIYAAEERLVHNYGDNGDPLVRDGKVVGIEHCPYPIYSPANLKRDRYTKVFNHLEWIYSVIKPNNK